jgi:two-component system phosphate regulon response regulator PhoB
MQNYVLIVEKEAAVRGFLTATLSEKGYSCVALSTGRAAVKHLQTQSVPALILLDLKVPGVKGSQFAEQFQANPQWREIPVGIISGEPREGLPFKQVAFFELPIDLGLLFAVATEYCDQE